MVAVGGYGYRRRSSASLRRFRGWLSGGVTNCSAELPFLEDETPTTGCGCMTRYDDDYNYVDTMVMTVATAKTTTVTPVCNLSLCAHGSTRQGVQNRVPRGTVHSAGIGQYFVWDI